MPLFYTLDEDRNPVPCDDPKAYRDWRATNWERTRIGRTVDASNPNRFVSTVFLGLDHNHQPDGEPILWESMAFDGSYVEQMQDRYTSEAAALVGHQRMVLRFFGTSAIRKEV